MLRTWSRAAARTTWLAAVVVALVAAALVFDLFMPTGVAAGILYVLVVPLVAWIFPSRALVSVGAGLTVLIVLGALLSEPGARTQVWIVNRVLSVVAVWVCVFLGHRLQSLSRGVTELVDAAPVGQMLVAHDGTILRANPTAEETLGVEQDGLLDRNVDEFVPLAERIRHSELRREYQRGPSARRMGEGRELEAVRADGSLVPVEVALAPLVLDDCPLVICTLVDITSRLEVRRARGSLASIVESSRDAIFSCDLEGRIQAWNGGAEELFDLPASSAVGESVRELLAPVSDHSLGTLLREVADGQDVRLPRERWTSCTGRQAQVGVVASPIRDGAGEVVGIAVVAHDVSSVLELEGQLLQAQKMETVGRLAGGVAHDFNNQLTIILGYTEAVLSSLPGEAAERGMLEQVRAAANRSALLTRQLLAYSRRQVLEPELLRIDELVRTNVGLLRRVIDASIRLEVHPGAPEIWVSLDPSQMDQVVMNLVINARDAMPEGGALTIATTTIAVDGVTRPDLDGLEPGQHVVLRVTDTGHGMDADTQARIFEPFFTTKAPGEGTGLGLSTVYGIVRQSGGDLRVRSVPGSGTTFEIFLPTVAPPDAGTGEAARGARGRGRGGVLVVEDEDVLRDLFVHTLVGAGHSVLAAADGVEARELLASHAGDVDVLVTDVVMPRMGGVELARLAREQIPDLPVLFVSGYAESAALDSRVLVRNFRFVAKPLSVDDLKAAVAELLATRVAEPHVG